MLSRIKDRIQQQENWPVKAQQPGLIKPRIYYPQNAILMTKVIITSAILLIHNAVNMNRLTGLKQRVVFLPFQ